MYRVCFQIGGKVTVGYVGSLLMPSMISRLPPNSILCILYSKLLKHPTDLLHKPIIAQRALFHKFSATYITFFKLCALLHVARGGCTLQIMCHLVSLIVIGRQARQMTVCSGRFIFHVDIEMHLFTLPRAMYLYRQIE